MDIVVKASSRFEFVKRHEEGTHEVWMGERMFRLLNKLHAFQTPTDKIEKERGIYCASCYWLCSTRKLVNRFVVLASDRLQARLGGPSTC